MLFLRAMVWGCSTNVCARQCTALGRSSVSGSPHFWATMISCIKILAGGCGLAVRSLTLKCSVQRFKFDLLRGFRVGGNEKKAANSALRTTVTHAHPKVRSHFLHYKLVLRGFHARDLASRRSSLWLVYCNHCSCSACSTSGRQFFFCDTVCASSTNFTNNLQKRTLLSISHVNREYADIT